MHEPPPSNVLLRPLTVSKPVVGPFCLAIPRSSPSVMRQPLPTVTTPEVPAARLKPISIPPASSMPAPLVNEMVPFP